MQAQQLNKGIAVVLFVYQLLLDLNRPWLLSVYRPLQTRYFDWTTPFTIDAQIDPKPVIFLIVVVIHRAFIHGLIIRLFTGSPYLLRIYVLLDGGVMLGALLLLVMERILIGETLIGTLLGNIFYKALDTPLLLLFFLPAFYLQKKGQKQSS